MKIGVDLVDIARIKRIYERSSGFSSLTYSPAELSLAEALEGAARFTFLAGRLAAKEATLKALGIGMTGGVAFTEVEILRMSSGAPRLMLMGDALDCARKQALKRYAVTISHDAGLAIAFVVLS